MNSIFSFNRSVKNKFAFNKAVTGFIILFFIQDLILVCASLNFVCDQTPECVPVALALLLYTPPSEQIESYCTNCTQKIADGFCSLILFILVTDHLTKLFEKFVLEFLHKMLK